MPLSQRKIAVVFGILAVVTVVLIILLIPVYMRGKRGSTPSETTVLTTTSTSTPEAATDPSITIVNKITSANLLTTKLLTTKSTSVPVGTTNLLKTSSVSTVEATTAAPEVLPTSETKAHITVSSPETTPVIEGISSNDTVPTDQTSVMTTSNEDLHETTTAIDIRSSEMSTPVYTSAILSSESLVIVNTTPPHLNLTNVSEAASFTTITTASTTKLHKTSIDTSNASSQILSTIPTNIPLNIETSIPVTSHADKTTVTTPFPVLATNTSVNSTPMLSLKQSSSILTTASM